MQAALRQNPEFWQDHLKKAAAKRVLTNTSKYNDVELSFKMIVIGAKQRCNNPSNAAYERYGGRGIKFCFSSNEEAMRWIAANLGPRPSRKYSIDRIDNNRHYEPGNLRWATPSEQNRNKRLYRRTVEGERVRYLLRHRTDYTRAGLDRYIKLGYSDEEILSMKKPGGGRPRGSRTRL
jgi:hypothetical protein